MIRLLRTFKNDTKGATAAEFALVLPVLILFLIGIIDVARLMWTMNQVEKATQIGVRFAVATDMVPSGLKTYSFALSGGIQQGDPIPQSSFGGATCQSNGSAVTCACNTGATCPALGTADSASFNRVVARMRAISNKALANNVVIEYGFSGLGFAGNPNGPEVVPLVTVRMRNITYQPLMLQLFGSSFSLPDFRASMTQEDGNGTAAN